MSRVRLRANTYRGPDAWFICDVCGQRWRRSQMRTRWDMLKVDWKCDDPRPPQMEPPDVYPEGMPFLDARPPQDNPDALVDGTHLQSVTGGFVATTGVEPDYNTGQTQGLGELSPQPIYNSPAPDASQASTVAARTIRTGPVSAGGEN